MGRQLRTKPIRCFHVASFAAMRGVYGGSVVASFRTIYNGESFVALCPELDIASQGRTVEEATANLKEAVELFLDSAEASEIEQRLRQPVFVTHFEITRG